jgi:predicted dehydrogenase
MVQKRFGVGIIGLQPGTSWAAVAHVPVLRVLTEDFRIIGVSNTSQESAEKAAATMEIERAFADVAELVAEPEVDVVTVTVKVPHHFKIVKAAIEDGKHVYCEWPRKQPRRSGRTCPAGWGKRRPRGCRHAGARVMLD